MMFDMTYFFYVLGGTVVGYLISWGVSSYQLLLLGKHIDETRKIIERNEEETANLRRRLSEFEEKFPDEPRSMWS